MFKKISRYHRWIIFLFHLVIFIFFQRKILFKTLFSKINNSVPKIQLLSNCLYYLIFPLPGLSEYKLLMQINSAILSTFLQIVTLWKSDRGVENISINLDQESDPFTGRNTKLAWSEAVNKIAWFWFLLWDYFLPHRFSPQSRLREW